MTSIPAPTLYHRLLGWHAPAMRRLLVATFIGVVVALVLLSLSTWQLALLGGWDAGTFTFLTAVWPIIIRADSLRTEHLATREDDTRGMARLLLLGASISSLLGVGLALRHAGQESGQSRALDISVALLTLVLSWIVVNTVYTLRYADLYFSSPAEAIAFGDAAEQERRDYRDFAYVAFTIGMTYQVSDTTVRDPRIRRSVLSHALLSYLFGVVIVAAAVNLIAGLLGSSH